MTATTKWAAATVMLKAFPAPDANTASGNCLHDGHAPRMMPFNCIMPLAGMKERLRL